MGTSISQASPKTSGWKAVSSCYTHESIPIDRVASEVWRAACRQDKALFDQLGSDVVTKCLSSASRSLSSQSAAETIRQLSAIKQNTVVAEFAKRALMIKSAGGHVGETATVVLFRQLTAYLVARDIPGYIGPSYRCKTVGDLRSFKEKIGNAVAERVQAIERSDQLSSRSWHEAYPIVLKKLQQV